MAKNWGRKIRSKHGKPLQWGLGQNAATGYYFITIGEAQKGEATPQKEEMTR